VTKVIAVLLESSNVGETSWAAVRGRGRLRIRGMKPADRLQIVFRPFSREIKNGTFLVEQDEDMIIPAHIEAVKVAHIQTSGSRVSVDLI
jgi:hypothetical protein